MRVSVTGADGDLERRIDFNVARIAYAPSANEYLAVWSADALATNDELEVFARRVGAGSPPQPAATPTPTPTPAADTTAPVLTLRAAKRQRIRSGRVRLRVRSSEACRLTVRARLRAGRKTRRFATQRHSLAAGTELEVALPLTRRLRRLARSALRHDRRAIVRLSLGAVDAAGNASTATSKVALRR
jgi:hypothetical protein